MKNALWIGFLVACSWVMCHPFLALAQESRAGSVSPVTAFDSVYTTLLQQIVTEDGRVRYDLLRGPRRRDFQRVLKSVETFDVRRLKTQAQKLAFWMNAYNIQMLQNIVERPEVNHILEDDPDGTFFNRPLLTAQQALSLNEIEHVVLRGQAGREELTPLRGTVLDPRIHVGLNCAAVSCPRLRKKAFTAENVSDELDAAMREFTASPAHFTVKDGVVVLSSLIEWYGADFDQQALPAGDYLLSFMPASRPHYLEIKKILKGHSAEEIKRNPTVRFAYQWMVNK